jgi:hypothetical protein
LLLAGSARADWTVTTSQTDQGAVAGVEHRRIVLTEDGTDKREVKTISPQSWAVKIVSPG